MIWLRRSKCTKRYKDVRNIDNVVYIEICYHVQQQNIFAEIN